MYNSQYYTCEEIDQRLLQGYFDDAVAAGYVGTQSKFLEGIIKAINYSANPYVNIIPDDTITTSMIQDKQVTGDKIAEGAVTTDKIAQGAIDSEQIQYDAVKNEHIYDGAITTDKLFDNCVRTDKLEDDAVTMEKLVDGSVVNKKLAPNAVSATKIADQAVLVSKIANEVWEKLKQEYLRIDGSNFMQSDLRLNDHNIEGVKEIRNFGSLPVVIAFDKDGYDIKFEQWSTSGGDEGASPDFIGGFSGGEFKVPLNITALGFKTIDRTNLGLLNNNGGVAKPFNSGEIQQCFLVAFG